MPQPSREVVLNAEIKDYRYGNDFIEDGALKQMDVATWLPINFGGVLMPDAHQGYGPPIGGVLAADNAVIPCGVGIGFRMALSVSELPPSYLEQRRQELRKLLLKSTRCCSKTRASVTKEVFKNVNVDDVIFDRAEFR